MKLSDYVADFISKLSPRVYTVCGAGAMHLNDSICHHPGIEAIAMHHEQAAAFAAEADARVTNNIGVVCVTAGPGGSNAVTGIACAYVDSIPMLVIAGQVTSSTMAEGGARPNGMNELPVAQLMEPITKYSAAVWEPEHIRGHLETALHLAMNGRRGPVFLEIPLDVQNAEIDPDELEPARWLGSVDVSAEEEISSAISLVESAQRPVLMIGNGIRLSGAEEALRRFLDRYDMPVVASWGARDIYPDALGSCGIFGDRQSNWAVQNADLIIAVGTRLSYPQTGHHRDLFAPNAKKIIVDIDYQEATKLKPDLAIVADCKAFLDAMNEHDAIGGWPAWSNECRAHERPEPAFSCAEGHHFSGDNGINAYAFIEQLSQHLADDAIVITDVGFSFIPTFQSLKLKPGQRLIHSGGVSPMGWAIPAAVGAAFAAPGRQIVCLTGDGGAMMNLQELQTIAHHKLPISIFVYANNGYATMQITQGNHFGRLAVSDMETGVSCPDWTALAAAFRIGGTYLPSHRYVDDELDRWQRPCLFELQMAPNQIIAPRVQSRMENGKFVPTPIDHMWPPLERPEAAE